MLRSNLSLPVLSLLLAATLWGVIWYPLRLLESAGLPGLWATLVMYATALLVSLPPLYRRRRELTRAPGVLLLMAVAVGWCNVAFVLAILDGNVLRVLLLFYLSPLWTVLLGRLFLGERLSPRAVLVFVTAVVGALIMLWDPTIGLPWPQARADWLALSAGLGFSIGNVAVRYLQQVSNWIKAGVNWAGVLVICAILLLTGRDSLPMVAMDTWLFAVGLGALGITIMTLAVQYGVTRMPVYRSSVILLFELVAGAVSAAWLAEEQVMPREWLGGSLIVLAAWLAGRLSQHSTRVDCHV